MKTLIENTSLQDVTLTGLSCSYTFPGVLVASKPPPSPLF